MLSAATSEGRSLDERREREADLSIEVAGIFLAIGGVLVGSVLPWSTAPTVPGYEGYGLLTSMLAVVVVGTAYWYGWTARTMLTTVTVGALVAGIALLNLAGGAIGVYVTLTAGIVLLGAGVNAYRKVLSR